jgi:hypothetical protein
MDRKNIFIFAATFILALSVAFTADATMAKTTANTATNGNYAFTQSEMTMNQTYSFIINTANSNKNQTKIIHITTNDCNPDISAHGGTYSNQIASGATYMISVITNGGTFNVYAARINGTPTTETPSTTDCKIALDYISPVTIVTATVENLGLSCGTVWKSLSNTDLKCVGPGVVTDQLDKKDLLKCPLQIPGMITATTCINSGDTYCDMSNFVIVLGLPIPAPAPKDGFGMCCPENYAVVSGYNLCCPINFPVYTAGKCTTA